MISRTTTAAVALVAALALTGCNGTTDEPDPTLGTDPAPTTSESDTATATPEPPADDTETTTAPPELSAEEQDEASITETVEGYFEDVFMAVSSGEAELSEINAWVVPPARDQEIARIQGYRAEGRTVVGTQEVEMLDVALDGDQATVESCVDVAGVDVLDESGESVVGDGPTRTLMDLVLVRSDERSVTGWQISEILTQGELCEED